MFCGYDGCSFFKIKVKVKVKIKVEIKNKNKDFYKMQEAVKVDKRRRANPHYAAYPKCQIGVSPELKELIRLNEIHNGGTGKIQHYVNDTVIPCHVQIMKAYQESTGKMWTMEEITRDIKRRFNIVNEILK